MLNFIGEKLSDFTMVKYEQLITRKESSLKNFIVLLYEFVLSYLNKKHTNNPCLHRAIYWYQICKYVNPSGRYKISIAIDTRKDWGHAWLTKNERSMAIPKHKIPRKLEKIGESENFIYWIAI